MSVEAPCTCDRSRWSATAARTIAGVVERAVLPEPPVLDRDRRLRQPRRHLRERQLLAVPLRRDRAEQRVVARGDERVRPDLIGFSERRSHCERITVGATAAPTIATPATATKTTRGPSAPRQHDRAAGPLPDRQRRRRRATAAARSASRSLRPATPPCCPQQRPRIVRNVPGS